MDEFELIERIRARAALVGAGSNRGDPPAPGLLIGIGDDCAVLERPAGSLAISTDTLNFGVHFDRHTTPHDLGHKALAVSLSDLAAMGARPRWALLNLSLPDDPPGIFRGGCSEELPVDFLDEFLAGFARLAERYCVALVGGDTCAGPLSVTVTALGEVDRRPLTRDAAQPGQRVVVSGALGSAALALEQRRAGCEPPASLARRLDRPQPRVELGQALAEQARHAHAGVGACIDLSDGLLADLGHVVAASNCGASLELAALPGVPELQALEPESRWALQLGGGDDYELCFTVEEDSWRRLRAWSADHGLALTAVGRIEAGEGVRCLRRDRTEFRPRRSGYQHFAARG